MFEGGGGILLAGGGGGALSEDGTDAKPGGGGGTAFEGGGGGVIPEGAAEIILGGGGGTKVAGGGGGANPAGGGGTSDDVCGCWGFCHGGKGTLGFFFFHGGNISSLPFFLESSSSLCLLESEYGAC